ncbi:MAG: BMP family ABC transporter substrate-binding protein, partial [Acidimicrobiales bacterium]
TQVVAFGPVGASSSIQELTATGFARAERELNVEVQFIGDQRFSDLEAEYRNLGNAGTEIVMINALDADRPWLEEVIADYPETAFVVIDPIPGPLEGATNGTFAPEEVAFLAGAAASLASEAGVIGYLGGLPYSETEAWRAGYEAGATTVNPNIEILSAYVSGGIEEGFETVGPGRAVALDLYERGADVVLHVAGTASRGAIDAARQHTAVTGEHVWAIAPDSDWSLVIADELQPHLLTSALKKFDVVVFELIEQYVEDELEPGVQVLSLSNGAMGLAPSDHLSPQQLQVVEDLSAQLVDGSIVAPTNPVGEILPRLVAGATETVPGAELDDIEIGDGFGPYAVGVEEVTIVDPTEGGRDLVVAVWFPIDDNAGLEPWQLVFPGDLVLESTHAFATTTEMISTDGPFPLVIYSHGDGGSRLTDSNYVEAIASHGYIVASPDHAGNTCCDAPDPRAAVAFNRPHDVSAVIDAMIDPDRAETAGFVSHVNTDQIAVTGHQGFSTYATVAGFENAVGQFVADDRVGAIIGIAPFVNELTDDQLASIDVPALVMIGSEDRGGASATRAWDLPQSSPSYRVDLVGGEHLSFTDICAYVELLDANPDVETDGFRDLMNGFRPQGCEPDDFPYERAQGITNTFATTFLDSVFRGADPIRLDQVDGQADLIYQVK